MLPAADVSNKSAHLPQEVEISMYYIYVLCIQP